jgi:phosphatidate cytidylyltransferase
MLKKRIITAVVLVGAVFFGLFYANAATQAIALLAICLVAGYEWLTIIKAKKIHSAVFYSVLTLCCLGFYLSPLASWIALFFSLLGWVAALVLVIAYQRGHTWWPSSLWLNCFIGLWVIAPMWGALYLLLQSSGSMGPAITLFLLIIIWSADIAAYFSGRAFGRHLLASRVSPGKSWQGVLGAFIGTSIVTCFMLIAFFADVLNFKTMFILSLFVVAISILGDLFESMVKRIYGVKDSSQLLPGHGGVLDRLDSLTAAAPLFAWTYFLL